MSLLDYLEYFLRPETTPGLIDFYVNRVLPFITKA